LLPGRLVAASPEEEDLCEQEKWEECGMCIDRSETALDAEDAVLIVDENADAESERTLGALRR
jgi:hypothetical protein